MLNSILLDTIIGLSFFYLVYSFLCLVITEVITRILNMRHKLLQNGLHKLFERADEGHLISKLNGSLSTIIGDFKQKRFYKRVSKLTPAQLVEGIKMTLKEEIRFSPRAPEDVSEELSYIKKLSKMLGEEEADKQESKKKEDKSKSDLLNKLEAKLNERLGAILDTVYDLYRRYAQKWALGIAFVIVLLNNADSIKYAKKIYNDSTFRNILVTSAERISQQELFEPGSGPGNQEQSKINPKFTDAIQKELEKSSLDIGINSWSNEPPVGQRADWNWIVQKLAGLFLTTALVSLGAPFWVDVLKTLVGFKKKNGKADSGAGKTGP